MNRKKRLECRFESALHDYYQQQEAAKTSKKRKAVAEPMMLDNEEYMDDLHELLGEDNTAGLLPPRNEVDEHDEDDPARLATNSTEV